MHRSFLVAGSGSRSWARRTRCRNTRCMDHRLVGSKTVENGRKSSPTYEHTLRLALQNSHPTGLPRSIDATKRQQLDLASWVLTSSRWACSLHAVYSTKLSSSRSCLRYHPDWNWLATTVGQKERPARQVELRSVRRQERNRRDQQCLLIHQFRLERLGGEGLATIQSAPTTNGCRSMKMQRSRR